MERERLELTGGSGFSRVPCGTEYPMQGSDSKIWVVGGLCLEKW